MRLVLAAAVLGLTAVAHATPHAQPKSAARSVIVIVRARIVSGTRQAARAYVSPAAATYVTEFPAPLVVAVAPEAAEGKARRVRFRCVTAGCKIAPADQPNLDAIHVVWRYVSPISPKKNILDPAAKDADVADGRAAIGIAIEAARPDATYVITATPLAQEGERAVPATFTLTSR